MQQGVLSAAMVVDPAEKLRLSVFLQPHTMQGSSIMSTWVRG